VGQVKNAMLFNVGGISGQIANFDRRLGTGHLLPVANANADDLDVFAPRYIEVGGVGIDFRVGWNIQRRSLEGHPSFGDIIFEVEHFICQIELRPAAISIQAYKKTRTIFNLYPMPENALFRSASCDCNSPVALLRYNRYERAAFSLVAQSVEQ